MGITTTIEKQRLLGALGKDTKKALKRAKFDDDAEGMIEVMVAGRLETDPKTLKMGVPVSIPELPKLRFVVVRFSNLPEGEPTGWYEETVRFSVTELITGRKVGGGSTAEEAIVDARRAAGKLTAKRIEEIQQIAA